MTAEPSGFSFTDEIPPAAAGTLIVRIPAKLNRKRRVLAEYFGRLRFPDYCGWNWDAFEEALRDLSWLDEVRNVIIVHRDLPFASSIDQQETYLSILRDRVTDARQRGPQFTVIFPPRVRSDVLRRLDQTETE